MGERWLALALVLLLGACTNKMEVAEAKLGQSIQALPGIYDRQGETQGGEALVLVIVPIYAPALSDYTFYVQEMVASDPRRITTQRVLSFDAAKDGKFTQTSWAMADPPRWRSGPTNPDLFKSMVKDDVRLGGRAEVTAEQLTAAELAFDVAGRIAATDAETAQLVRYRKR
jgi:hypothetical protein